MAPILGGARQRGIRFVFGLPRLQGTCGSEAQQTCGGGDDVLVARRRTSRSPATTVHPLWSCHGSLSPCCSTRSNVPVAVCQATALPLRRRSVAGLPVPSRTGVELGAERSRR